MMTTTIPTISAKRLHELRGEGQGVELIDVRTPAEYGEMHADIAQLTPLTSLDPQAYMSSRERNGDTPLYVICQTGGRSRKAVEQFHAHGFTNVLSVEGGTEAWERAGLPVVRVKKSISLERQVRIAAGLLVLLGALLGWFVHPYFVGLSAFVGAGLVFAGLTDTCGMGMLISRMPWNQRREKGETCTL